MEKKNNEAGGERKGKRIIKNFRDRSQETTKNRHADGDDEYLDDEKETNHSYSACLYGRWTSA